MQPVTGPSGRDPLTSDDGERRAARVIAITLAVLALGFGVAGLMTISPEQWGAGLIGFGCLLAILSLLAQGAEHFARAAAARSK